ncbi:MAG TPA: hypothetical protein PLF27_08165 [Sedimentibacter sp.]|nr:hypothetical protein [Sedimentibacter sp.]
MKYVVIKPFNDITGFKIPGESIELDDARAAKLRAQGLIGGVWKDEPKPSEPTLEELEKLKEEIHPEKVIKKKIEASRKVK